MSFRKYGVFFAMLFAFLVVPGSVYSANQGQAFDGGPLQISIFPPYQLMPEDYNVYGLRLAAYGYNFSVYGCDFGFWTRQRGDLCGFGFSGLSSKQGNMYGVNIGGIINYTKGDEFGWSMAGVINDVDGTIQGLQSTIVYNEAKKVEGVQLALVNYCQDMSGVQLGIVNICDDQWIPFTIIFNVWFSSDDDENKSKK